MDYCYELDKHRISTIEFKRVRNRYPRLFGKNARLGEHSYGASMDIVIITTDKGARGWGLTQVAGHMPLTHLIGAKVSALIDPLVGIRQSRYKFLDFALHDLAGVILGVPVYKMLGEQGTTTAPCYDGAIYMNDISVGNYDNGIVGVGRILKDCYEDYQMGYRDFKIKIGRGDMWMSRKEGLVRDIEVTRKVREVYPSAKIMVDANDAYTVDECVDYIKQVADCNLYWIEEPFRESKEGFTRLKEVLSVYSPETLIADGESDPDVPFLLSLAKEGLLDVLQMDIQSYGFTSWRRLMPTIDKYDLRISPHNWGKKIKTHYTAHIGAGYGHVLHNEGVPDESEGIIYKNYKLKDGMLTIPDSPGFGMTYIWGHDAL